MVLFLYSSELFVCATLIRMMKKIYFYSLICFIFSPLFASAKTTVEAPQEREVTYQPCKKAAIAKKEKTMSPVLKAYVASSEAINEQTKRDYDSIKWYMETTYDSEAKKIEERRSESMSAINAKVTKARLIAQTTWKAEDALCEFAYASTNDRKAKSDKK